ncbi:LAMP3 protein, partial [Cisticola juncidis]|nr:LAMP3 protein [Cisticola juncidis]
TPSALGTAATSAPAASGTHRAGPGTRAQGQTTAVSSTAATPAGTHTAHTGTPTAHTSSHGSTATTHTGTHTAPTSSPGSTARPRPGPQPPAIPTGTYSLSDGNGTCVKAVMGLQLMARNVEQGQMEYLTVNPNATKISGSCGMVQSELNLTFNGGFVNFTFVK